MRDKNKMIKIYTYRGCDGDVCGPVRGGGVSGLVASAPPPPAHHHPAPRSQGREQRRGSHHAHQHRPPV